MKKKELYLIALTFQSIVVALALFRLFNIIKMNDKAQIMVTCIWLFLSIIALICFLFLFNKQRKIDAN